MVKAHQFNRKSLACAIGAITLGGALGSPAALAQGEILEEVIVTGSFRDSLANALNVKRNSTAAVDSIVADDIASFPDNNLAEAMQRIPGVNIERVGGEGRQISVRGLSSDFTRVRVNGMETISTGVGNTGRSFDFNIFASELFNRIDVRKSQSAEIDEGSLGATVDLYTGKPLDYEPFVFVTSIQGGYNSQAESVDPRLTALISATNDEGTFGGAFSIAYSRRNLEQFGHNSGRWEANNNEGNNQWANADDLPDEVNNAVHPRFPRQVDRDYEIERTGLTGSLQWAPTDRTMVTLDALYAKIDTTYNELTLTPISLARTGATGRIETTVLDYEYDPNNNGLVYADLSGVDVRSEYMQQLWNTEFHQISVTLEHEFTDTFRMNALVGTSESDFQRPRETTAIFENFNADMSYDYRDSMSQPQIEYGFDPADPGVWWVSELRDRPASTKNTFDNFRIGVEYDLFLGEVDLTLKSGLSWKEFYFQNFQAQRDRATIDQGDHENLSTNFPEGCDISLSDLEVTASMGDVFQPSGGLPAYFLPNRQAVADQFGLYTDDTCFPIAINQGADRDVTEESLGFFFQVDFATHVGTMPLRGDVGVRQVETDQTSSGLLSGDRIVVNRDYSDTLPALNLVLEATDDVLLRASWSEVLSRPSLGQLTPGGSVDVFNRGLTAGNPAIDPFRATATDLSVEWYFAPESMLSVAYFHKDIESFPQTLTDEVPWSTLRNLGYPDSLLDAGPATTEDQFTYRRSVNGEGGKLDGWEIQYQQPLFFGPEWLQDFGIRANYTYIESEVDGGVDADGNRILRPLTGQSKNSWNTTLWYENADFAGRVSWSHRDGYIRGFTSTAGPGADTTDSVRVVDAAFSYDLNDNVRFKFDALNLTNEPETWLQSDYNFVDTMVKSGRQYYLGVQYTY